MTPGQHLETPGQHLEALRGEAAAFHDGVADLDVAVPACAPWRVRDLVRHLGSVHRMFRRAIDEGWMTRPPPLPEDDRPAADDDEVVGWGRRQTQSLLAALSVLDPARPCWNFTDGPQVGAFVFRRMLHETAVHRHDLQEAYGDPEPIAAEIARDGVLEYLEVQLPRRGDWPHGAASILVVADGEPLATVELSPHAPATSRRASSCTSADVVMRGTAEQLLLAWWGRAPFDALATGRPEAIGAVRDFRYG